MTVKSLPQDYSSALADNIFAFTDVDSSVATEISFHLEDGNDTLLGTKRYTGLSEINASVSNFLRRSLAPEPAHFAMSQFHYPEGRNLFCYASWTDSEGTTHRTESVHFTASTSCLDCPAAADAKALQQRTIGRTQMDEIAFTAPAEAKLQAFVTYPDGQTLNTAAYTDQRAGLWVFSVNMASLLQLAGGGEDFSKLTVSVCVDGQEVVRVEYLLADYGSGAECVAWLSPSGAIAYHTFPRAIEESWQARRNSVECSGRGWQVVGSAGWREWQLQSGHLSDERAERLAEVLSAPCVWLCVADSGVEPVVLVGGHATVAGGGGGAIELRLRPCTEQLRW